MMDAKTRTMALRLEYFTIAWNAFEGTAAIALGVAAHSVALTGYGLDSALEVAASSAAVWQLRAIDPRRDARALRLIGTLFLVVAIYVGATSILNLAHGIHAGQTPLGIVVTAAAVVVMTWLGIAKRRAGRTLVNPVLMAEATFSLVDAALSATVLVGLAANALLNWWWADPVAAMAVSIVAGREASRALRSAR